MATSGAPARIFVTAFGETKILRDWETDPRCVVSYQNLYIRIVRFGWGPERAITSPTLPRRGRKNVRKLCAFGEEKTLKEWARDARCAVREVTLRKRLYYCWDAEAAVSAPLRGCSR